MHVLQAKTIPQTNYEPSVKNAINNPSMVGWNLFQLTKSIGMYGPSFEDLCQIITKSFGMQNNIYPNYHGKAMLNLYFGELKPCDPIQFKLKHASSG